MKDHLFLLSEQVERLKLWDALAEREINEGVFPCAQRGSRLSRVELIFRANGDRVDLWVRDQRLPAQTPERRVALLKWLRERSTRRYRRELGPIRAKR
jgi:hypothetical protein